MGEDEAVHKELGDNLVRAATTAFSLEAEQDSGAKKPQGRQLLKLGLRMYLNIPMMHWSQENEIDSLKRKVKKLEKKRSSRTHKLKRLYRVGLTARVESSGDEEDLALEALKTSKPKVKGIVFQELSKSTTTTIISSQQSQDKGKGIMIEEHVKPMKKKDQISFDKEVALKLPAEFDENERLAREKAKKEKEVNIALIETWDDIQAKINVDYQLAERLQAQEQEELSIEEKANISSTTSRRNKKPFAAKRAEEKRNKPPTKAQQRKIMCTYLKNMEGYKLNDLKLKGFDSIQEMFYRAFKRVNTFEDFRTELVEGKENRAGTELIQEITKKQKVEDDKENEFERLEV
ncbi:hypothetical protein Tco_0472071 [Tanacetum coccineum]